MSSMTDVFCSFHLPFYPAPWFVGHFGSMSSFGFVQSPPIRILGEILGGMGRISVNLKMEWHLIAEAWQVHLYTLPVRLMCACLCVCACVRVCFSALLSRLFLQTVTKFASSPFQVPRIAAAKLDSVCSALCPEQLNLGLNCCRQLQQWRGKFRVAVNLRSREPFQESNNDLVFEKRWRTWTETNPGHPPDHKM